MAPHPKSSGRPPCELCGSGAVAFCHADDAFLCISCDAKVHSANFLVSRHLRNLLCCRCKAPTSMRLWGSNPAVPQTLCPHCGGAPAIADSQELCFPPAAWHTGVVDGAEEVRRRSMDVGGGDEAVAARRAADIEEENGGNCWEAVGERSASPVSVLSSEDCSGGSYSPSSNEDDFSGTMPAESEESETNGTRGRVKHRMPGRQRAASAEMCRNDYSSRKRKRDEVEESENGSSSSSTPGATNQQVGALGEQAAARLQRVLISWQAELGLSGSSGAKLGFHLVRRALQRLQPHMRKLAADSLRITLAACLWLALKLGTEQTCIPKASRVAEVTGVSASRLTSMEVQLLSLLDWRPLEGYLDESTD